MTDPKCELCEMSDNPHSQSKHGFQLQRRSVYGAPRRLLCTNCIAYLKRHKNMDFAIAKMNRVGRKVRLAASKSYIGQCECCKLSEIEVKSRTFRYGELRKTVCKACQGSIQAHPEMSFEELRKDRLWRSKQIEKYRNSEYSPIPEEDRVRIKIAGEFNNEKYECRRCGRMRIIWNPRYHLCQTCTKHEEYIGESCECCYRVSDGTFGMAGEFSDSDGITERSLFCMNCKKRILTYGIDKQELMQIMAIKNCQICEVELIEGKVGSNARCIDHEHRTGRVRGVVCTSCNKAEGHIAKVSEDLILWTRKLMHYLQSWREQRYHIGASEVDRTDDMSRSETVEKYRNSEYSPIPEGERVPSRIAGVLNKEKYECRRCGQMKKIKNVSYHLCDSCLKKEEFIGESCDCCNRVADGTAGMTRSHLTYMTQSKKSNLFCANCWQKMNRFGISKYRLAKLMSINNCQICDMDLGHGKEAIYYDNASNIDHDHRTGEVRGILCPNCNKAEGYIDNITQDPITWAEKLQGYLLGTPSD